MSPVAHVFLPRELVSLLSLNARYRARVCEVIIVAGCDVTLTLSVGGSVNGVLLLAPENCTVEVCTKNIDITVNNKSSKIHLVIVYINHYTLYLCGTYFSPLMAIKREKNGYTTRIKYLY
jgi:hypothetical protein